MSKIINILVDTLLKSATLVNFTKNKFKKNLLHGNQKPVEKKPEELSKNTSL